MPFRISNPLMIGVTEGAKLLVDDYRNRENMAQRMAILEAEKQMIAMRDQLEHQREMQKMKMEFGMRAWEARQKNKPQEMSQEETEWWEARTEKLKAEAGKARKESRDIDDRERKNKETNLDLIRKRMGEITYQTKGDEIEGELPSMRPYSGFENEYRVLQSNEGTLMRDLGAISNDDFQRQYNSPKPNPANLGLIPEAMRTVDSQYGPGDVGGAMNTRVDTGIAGQPGAKPSFYEE